MATVAFAGFLFLTLCFLSLWIGRDPKIWGSLLGLSLVCGLITGNILWVGLVFLAALTALWLFYVKKPKTATFIALIIATLAFKLSLIPGFPPIFLTPKFQIGFPSAIIGVFPLAFLTPLSRTLQDWKKVLQGLTVGCGGIGILAILATLAGVTQWDFKLPSFMLARIWGNLFLATIPEEGFYRGFLQEGLSRYFGNTKKGKIIALFLTSLLFTFAHVYWSPDIALLGFVFLTSLLYGSVYLYSEKIESAILCHFLLNLIHMVFFEYHAM